jgi:hypothetical protein
MRRFPRARPFELLDRICEVDRASIDSSFFESANQDFPGWTDEGFAGSVFLIPRLLAEEHEGGAFATFTENSLSRVFISGQDVQWAAIIRSFVRLAVLGTCAGRQSTLDFLAGLFFITISTGTSSAEISSPCRLRKYFFEIPLRIACILRGLG